MYRVLKKGDKFFLQYQTHFLIWKWWAYVNYWSALYGDMHTPKEFSSLGDALEYHSQMIRPAPQDVVVQYL